MNARRLTQATVVSLCTTVALVLSCVPTQAAVTHEFLKQITEVPTLGPKGEAIAVPGPLERVTELAADDGELYVAEPFGPERVDTFNEASGAFLLQFPPEPAFAAQGDLGLAVSTSTGATEVLLGGDTTGETCAAKVLVHNGKGTLIGEWSGADTPAGAFGCASVVGLAADNSSSLNWASGDVYVANASTGKVDVFKPLVGGSEEFVTELEAEPGVGFQFRESEAIVVNGANGDLLVTNGATAVEIYKPAAIVGQFEKVGELTGTPKGLFQRVPAIGADNSTGDIYVVDNGAATVDEFDATGTFLGRLTGTPKGSFGSLVSIAMDSASHDLYVGDTADQAVDVFGPNETIPDVTTEAASAVTPEAATLQGTVNPSGIVVTDCHFEYGATAAYGSIASCVPAVGSGSSDVAVHADVFGLEPGATYHFRLVASDVNGENVGEDRRFGPPTAGAETVESIEQTAATLHAAIDPNGVATHYRFELGTTTAYGASVPVPDGSVGADEAAHEVTAALSGLEPGVRYHYRVVAVNSAGTTTRPDRTFVTTPAAQIDSVTISNVGPTSARVEARINPLGHDTHYRFEYGASAAYGSSVPVPDGDIGEGSADVTVHAEIEDVTPAISTYHVRVVATNAVGTAVSQDHTFVYDTSSQALPDNRAYEMVTPPQKNGALIGNVTFGVPQGIAENGSSVILGVVQCFADAVSCEASTPSGNGSPYAFTRDLGGWQPHSLAPSATEFEANAWELFEPNSDAGLFLTRAQASPTTDRYDFYSRGADGSFRHIGPLAPPLPPHEEFLNQAKTGTADLSHVLFQSPTTGGLWPAFDPTLHASLYEYSRAGNSEPALVGIEPGGSKLVSECGTFFGGAPGIGVNPGALSADGGIVYFTALGHNGLVETCPSSRAAPPVSELDSRIDNGEPDAHTVAVSEPAPAEDQACTKACLANLGSGHEAQFRDGHFVGASSSGSDVFFTDTQQLTDTASEDPNPSDSASHTNGCSGAAGANGCNLYEFECPNQCAHPSERRLIDVSAGDTSGEGPRVQGVMAFSSDATHIYFVARGVLTSRANGEGQQAEDGAENLYAWERTEGNSQGHVAFVATLPESDLSEWVEAPDQANVTPDGRFLVFTSRGALTPDVTRTDGAQQVFRYDAQTEALVRVSIGQAGFNDNGNAGTGDGSIVPGYVGIDRLGPVRPDPTMSNDGAYVFFMSPVGLTPLALNDVHVHANGGAAYAQNVYEFHGGHVYLISDGRDTASANSNVCPADFSAVCLLGTDATGSNVFFMTTDQLVPQDTDTQLDVYDARICTAESPCLKTPPPSPPPCLGEACHGTPPAVPPLVGVPSATFNGQGNLTQPVPTPPRPKLLPRSGPKGLAHTLKTCRRKHNKHQRAECEKSARRRYGPVHPARKAPRAKKTFATRRASNERRARS